MHIKTILIDDERPALRGMEYLLSGYEFIEIIGSYINPLTAIEEIEKTQPQLVFLDINMPQVQGLDAASKIMDFSPDTDIVFVTAYDQYAVNAFELHALDYLLKPVSKNRLDKTLQRISDKISTESLNTKNIKPHLEINTLGNFSIQWPGTESIKWRTQKTKELAAFLIHNHNIEVSRDKIIENIWPCQDLKSATSQLYNGIYYIRKTLEDYGVSRELMKIAGKYCLSISEDVVPDFVQFKTLVIDSQKALDITSLEGAESCWNGNYMASEGWLWSYPEEANFEKLYIKTVIQLSNIYIKQKKNSRAEKLLIKGFQQAPYDENITKHILNLYKATGQNTQATQHFEKYKSILKNDLNIQPEKSIAQLFNSI